jgi:hypothetical protein
MDSGAVEHNGVGVDVFNACWDFRETSHNASINIDDQSHLGDGVWLRLLLFRFHCPAARQRQSFSVGICSSRLKR